jgi:hypothetical protein
MKKLIIAIVATFVTIWVTDYLIHEVGLKNAYVATKSHWRPEAEMMARMPWMMLGQLVAAIGFATIYVKALANSATIKCAFFFGLFIGLIQAGGQLMTFAVEPLPGSLIAKWIIASLGQSTLVGLVLFFVCKPAKSGVAVG